MFYIIFAIVLLLMSAWLSFILVMNENEQEPYTEEEWKQMSDTKEIFTNSKLKLELHNANFTGYILREVDKAKVVMWYDDGELSDVILESIVEIKWKKIFIYTIVIFILLIILLKFYPQ